MVFKKAERKKAKLRLAICGPSGSGKTYSALLVAFGLGGKIAVIDTERGSAELYSEVGGFDVCVLEPPYTPVKYIETIKEAERAGYAVIIIDSLSHAWQGEGGLLDIHSNITSRTKNSFSAWREVTPLHNNLVDTLLQSSCHIIVTLRAKTEYLVDEGGKKIQKVGLAPIQRDGLEYEFTIFGDISLASHCITITKDRTGKFQDKMFVITKDFGVELKRWLESSKPLIPDNTPKGTTEEFGSSNTFPAKVFHLVSAEKKASNSGKVFAKVTLADNNGEVFTAWAANEKALIAELPAGTLVEVQLEKQEDTLVITDFNVIDDEASVA